MTVQPARQPRLRGNDWPSLTPPALGAWQPSKAVSVVVPAYQAASTLPFVLAALHLQTYPSHLLEVLVVDDGSEPPVVLPDLRPEHTRLIRTTDAWGKSQACNAGVAAAEGEVIHLLDADMMVHRDEVEAHLRWHHLVDYAVVLGSKRFVDLAGGLPGLEETLDLVREGRADDLFGDRDTTVHQWVEDYIATNDRLTANPTKSYLVHVGASVSLARDLYLQAGGMDVGLLLGEDIELGYRLSQLGAVFVPDQEARSWHLGQSTLMEQQESVNRHNRPYLTDRLSDLRHWRTKGRSYTVPWVQVVLDASDATFEDVRHSVNGALTGSIADVEVVVLDPTELGDGRRSALADPDRDRRMLRAEFAGEPRVRFTDAVPDTAFPAAYRLVLPAGWSPGKDTVRRLAREMARKDRGVVSALMPDGQVSRLERTAAVSRALRVRTDGEDLDAVVDQVSATWWFDGPEEGFTHVTDAAGPAPSEDPDRADRPAPSVRPSTDGAAQPPAGASLRRLLGRAARRAHVRR